MAEQPTVKENLTKFVNLVWNKEQMYEPYIAILSYLIESPNNSLDDVPVQQSAHQIEDVSPEFTDEELADVFDIFFENIVNELRAALAEPEDYNIVDQDAFVVKVSTIIEELKESILSIGRVDQYGFAHLFLAHLRSVESLLKIYNNGKKSTRKNNPSDSEPILKDDAGFTGFSFS